MALGAESLLKNVMTTANTDTFGVGSSRGKGSAPAPVVPNPGSVSVPVDNPVSGFDWLSGAGSLIGGVSSLVGGLLSYSQQKKANEIAQKQFAENLAFQKDQYYNAMYNRVVDAKHAGVHPLAALGISAHGSASPTAHVQSATGLGQALQNLGGSINAFFENRIKWAQLDSIESQIAANKAMAVKYASEAGKNNAATALINKDVANYNLYRVWNSINNSIGSVSRLVRPGVNINKTSNWNPVYQENYLN